MICRSEITDVGDFCRLLNKGVLNGPFKYKRQDEQGILGGFLKKDLRFYQRNYVEIKNDQKTLHYILVDLLPKFYYQYHG